LPYRHFAASDVLKLRIQAAARLIEQVHRSTLPRIRCRTERGTKSSLGLAALCYQVVACWAGERLVKHVCPLADTVGSKYTILKRIPVTIAVVLERGDQLDSEQLHDHFAEVEEIEEVGGIRFSTGNQRALTHVHYGSEVLHHVCPACVHR
jgi:hypothetical protein